MEWLTEHWISWLVFTAFIGLLVLLIWLDDQKRAKTEKDYRYLCHDEWWWYD